MPGSSQARWNWFKLFAYAGLISLLAAMIPTLVGVMSNGITVIPVLMIILLALTVAVLVIFLREHPTRIILKDEELVVDLGRFAGRARLLRLRREDILAVQPERDHFRLAPLTITISGKRYTWILSRGLTRAILGRLATAETHAADR